MDRIDCLSRGSLLDIWVPYLSRLIRGDAIERAQWLCLEGLRSLCVASGRELEIHQLAGGVNGPPQVTPLTTNTIICFVHEPIEACAAEMALGPFGQLWPKL